LKRHGSDLDPAVLAELRKIAAIRENPYALLRAQYVSSHNQYASTPGDWMVPPRTAAEEFDSKIGVAIYVAHLCIALSNPKKLTARKRIASRARACQYSSSTETGREGYSCSLSPASSPSNV
jgi:hypothetical protein